MDKIGKLRQLLVLSAVIAVVWTQSDADVSISLDISEEKVLPGANVTLNCRIKGISSGEIVYWSKGEDNGDEENPSTQLIATNDLLSPLFQSTRRYYPSIVEIGDVHMYIMHIYGVTEYESGTFVCSIPRLAYRRDYAVLSVYEQAKEINFMNVSDERHMFVTEDEPIPIHCHVTQVNPIPKLTMYLGTRNLSPRMRISHEKNIHCERSSESCPLNVDYNVHAVVERHNASWLDDGQELICQSRLLDSGYNPMEVQRIVKVEYRPKFICSTMVKGRVGTQDYELSCLVYYNPPPAQHHMMHNETDTQFWSFNENGVDVKLPIGLSIGVYDTDITIKEDNAYLYSLIITELQPHHVNISYNLHVTNMVGHNMTSIFLMEDVRDGGSGGTGSAAALLWSVTTLTFATMLSIVH